ncbi:hypothetical protein AJ78_05271 [Emergomyces pasteurianus Ep9510]|uniref:Uncharacterized protein n=1 Tax=Emergomyces pasteurianus Ep9510 TaxID=1447872 RepID=A0A1J9PEB5_9EURO|nr:hypothetical protein AJ78_05271 [Emergomyces pasteurianus Ep9510]
MAVAKPTADDINQLVALASRSGCNTVERWKNARNAIDDIVAKDAHDRTAKILNAIATILVERPRGGVFAVGARIIHSRSLLQEGSVQLFLAGNDNIPDEMKQYLEDVWQILQKMAVENRKKLLKKSHMRRSNYFDVTPLKNNDTEATGIPANYLELMQKVYIHGSKKWLQRLNKLYSALRKFIDVVFKHVVPGLADNDSEYKLLDDVVYVLREVEWINTQLEDSEGRDKTPELMSNEQFLRRMCGVGSVVSSLSPDNFTRLDKLNEADKEARKPISCRLNKFVALQFAIAQLERFTRSPRFYRILTMKLVEVICINKSETTVTLPSDAAGWINVLKLALKTSSYEMNEKSETILLKTTPQLKENTSKCPVHCEFNLLKYFASTDFKPPPISYIGVYKLSCAACAAVFAAWNELHDRRFKTRGSHGKWYPAWAAPMGWENKVNEEQLYSSIYQKISDSFTQALNERGFITRILSDSSADSGEELTGFEAENREGVAMALFRKMKESESYQEQEKKEL